jgi:hypothetical protein
MMAASIETIDEILADIKQRMVKAAEEGRLHSVEMWGDVLQGVKRIKLERERAQRDA